MKWFDLVLLFVCFAALSQKAVGKLFFTTTTVTTMKNNPPSEYRGKFKIKTVTNQEGVIF